MKKTLLAIAVTLLSVSAHAEQFQAAVAHADCTLVAKSGSAAGAIIGGGVGAGVGAAVGGAIFGKKWGRALGGLAGGAGGAIAGENIGASKTYSCIVKVISPSGEGLYGRTTSAQPYVVGQTVMVTKTGNEILIQ